MTKKTARYKLERGCYLDEDGKFAQAFKYFLKAAKNGSLEAQVNLGNYYSDGVGCRKNSNRAVYWYKRAYKSGLDYGAYNLGLHYHGHGKLREAKYWFKKAAEMGNEDAIDSLQSLKDEFPGRQPNSED